MNLSDFDLRQLAARDLSGLSAAEKDRLLGNLLGDLIEARERLKANSRTSSRPPSSDPPWSGAGGEDQEPAEEEPERGPSEDREDSDGGEKGERLPPNEGRAGGAKPDQKKPGRKPGAAGHSRSVTLPVTATVLHIPPECALCGAGLPENELTAPSSR